MALGPPELVEAPAVEKSPHGLLDCADVEITPEGERWVQGFQFWPDGAYEAIAWDPACDADPVEKSNSTRFPGVEFYNPYIIEVAVTCNPAGITEDEFRSRALHQLEMATETALETELWTGMLRGYGSSLDAADQNVSLGELSPLAPGPNLAIANAGAPGAPVALSPSKALAALQRAIGASTPGGRAFIHTPMDVAQRWAEFDLKEDDDGRLITKVAHNVVVAGGGYEGLGPENIVPDAGTTWVMATGPVKVLMTEGLVLPDTMGEALNRRTNDIEYRAERYVAAFFDPSRIIAVLVDMTV